MSRHLLLIGGGLMQLPVIDHSHAQGVQVVCLDGNPQALAKEKADFFVVCDIKDREACASAAREHRSRHRLDGVITVGTDFSTTVAWVAQALQIPGIPFETALRAKDKGLMRQVFRDNGVSSPDFLVAEQRTGLPADPPFGFPCVVKPADSMGGRGVQLVSNTEEMHAAVALAWSHSPSGRAVVEEFIEGREFSLDCLVVDGTLRRMGLADRHIVFPPYFVEIGHSFPSTASPVEVEALWAEFQKAIRAVGITNGVAKGDVKWSRRGPTIGEIAARLSGGFMSGWTYPLSSGRCAIPGAIALALGDPVVPVPDDVFAPVAERAWISIPGTLRAVHGLDTVRTLPGVRHVFVTLKPGQKLVFPTNNVEKAGNLICTGATFAEAEENARHARNALTLELEGANPATERFLFGDDSSPWWFPQAERSQWKDPYGNSSDDLLERLRALGRMPAQPEARFWRALAKGGLQGALYVDGRPL